MSIAHAPWMRISLATLSIAFAAILLGILLLVATQPGEGAVRRLDLLLSQSADLAPRILDGVDAAILGDDEVRGTVDALSLLRDGLRTRIGLAADAIEEIEPAQPGTLDHLRAIAVRAFDLIEPDPIEEAGAGGLRGQIAAVDANLQAFSARIDAFSDALIRLRSLRTELRDQSLDLVSDLRRRRLDAEADEMYAGVEQFLERSRGRLGMTVEEAAGLTDALRSRVSLADAADVERLDAIVSGLADLLPARDALEGAAASVRDTPLPQLLTTLRARVGADVVHRLAMLSDARVVLNVYTALLLVVLVYFGLRLSGSYAALNRSHDDLERRVEARTEDLARANEEIKDSQVQLVQAEKMSSVGQLVAGVMHEINTPLMYVQSNVETIVENLEETVGRLQPALALCRALRSGAGTSASAVREMAAAIDPDEFDALVSESRQLSTDSLDGLVQISELVQSLKDFSRIDRADQELFDVREGLEKTLTITRNLTKHGVEIVRDFQEVPKISCGPSRINQVFMNLITNAVQAMNGEGRLTLSVRPEGQAVVIAVTDTGCGIAPEHLARIEEPFFTTKPVGQGTGLGLSIVRRIIDEHGGDLRVSSRQGQGTTITVRLPARTHASEEAA
ncbi:MAG: ATP-binding protein [Pseudomonadales bacterium]|jgi:signal transduction histidine kinase|nr:ATP-binding protein [Pseudomonadales bacterium]